MTIVASSARVQPKIGSRVLFSWGLHKVVGRIVEDRGNIGIGGRRLYRIEAYLDPEFRDAEDKTILELGLDQFEVREDETDGRC